MITSDNFAQFYLYNICACTIFNVFALVISLYCNVNGWLFRVHTKHVQSNIKVGERMYLTCVQVGAEHQLTACTHHFTLFICSYLILSISFSFMYVRVCATLIVEDQVINLRLRPCYK